MLEAGFGSTYLFDASEVQSYQKKALTTGVD